MMTYTDCSQPDSKIMRSGIAPCILQRGQDLHVNANDARVAWVENRLENSRYRYSARILDTCPYPRTSQDNIINESHAA